VRHVGDAGEEQEPAPIHPAQDDGARLVFLGGGARCNKWFDFDVVRRPLPSHSLQL
jgi:hypothetical protein